jgi:hypothetical protein
MIIEREKVVYLFIIVSIAKKSFFNMPKKYTREPLFDAVSSNLDSKAAAIEFNVPASTIRQHRREPFLKVRAGRPS